MSINTENSNIADNTGNRREQIHHLYGTNTYKPKTLYNISFPTLGFSASVISVYTSQ